jgi:hypothetical protein
MIDGREMMKFEAWMDTNYPNVVQDWEITYSEFMDLDDYVKEKCHYVWSHYISSK